MKTLLFLSFFFSSVLAFAQTWQATYAQADSLRQKRSFKEAISLYEQALPMAEKEYGRNTEQYLLTRNGLGNSIIFVKKKEEIEPFLLENVELCKKYGEKTPIYAQALHNAGTFYLPSQIGNNPVKAEEYLKQALALRKEVLGTKHKDYAASLNNLAVLYSNMGNYTAAEPLYQEALQMYKEVFGTKHSDYARSLNNLAVLYLNMGNYAAAEPLLKEALQIQKVSLGTKYPEYAQSLGNLSELYRAMNRFVLADSLGKMAFEIRKQTENLNLFSGYNGLGTIQLAQGRYAEAEENLRKGDQHYWKNCKEKAVCYIPITNTIWHASIGKADN